MLEPHRQGAADGAHRHPDGERPEPRPRATAAPRHPGDRQQERGTEPERQPADRRRVHRAGVAVRAQQRVEPVAGGHDGRRHEQRGGDAEEERHGAHAQAAHSDQREGDGLHGHHIRMNEREAAERSAGDPYLARLAARGGALPARDREQGEREREREERVPHQRPERVDVGQPEVGGGPHGGRVGAGRQRPPPAQSRGRAGQDGGQTRFAAIEPEGGGEPEERQPEAGDAHALGGQHDDAGRQRREADQPADHQEERQEQELTVRQGGVLHREQHPAELGLAHPGEVGDPVLAVRRQDPGEPGARRARGGGEQVRQRGGGGESQRPSPCESPRDTRAGAPLGLRPAGVHWTGRGSAWVAQGSRGRGYHELNAAVPVAAGAGGVSRGRRRRARVAARRGAPRRRRSPSSRPRGRPPRCAARRGPRAGR